jgi:hypothetical protein
MVSVDMQKSMNFKEELPELTTRIFSAACLCMGEISGGCVRGACLQKADTLVTGISQWNLRGTVTDSATPSAGRQARRKTF